MTVVLEGLMVRFIIVATVLAFLTLVFIAGIEVGRSLPAAAYDSSIFLKR